MGQKRRVIRSKSLRTCLLAVLAIAGVSDAALAKPARPLSAAARAEARAEAAMIKRFEPLEIEDALVDQHDRIVAAVAALPPHAAAAETTVLAIGGQGYQAIFDREARRAAAVLSARGGGPALVLSNTPAQVESGLLASRRTVALAIAALGRRARPNDTLVVYLASHGGEDASIAMDAPYIEFAPLSAADLATALDGAGFKRRIIIISACFAGSWIDKLASPTTIVIAAAAKDRTSFGCDDSREFTFFGEAMLGELARPGQSLELAFDHARQHITAGEKAQRVTPSLPEARVGAAMQAAWTAAP